MDKFNFADLLAFLANRQDTVFSLIAEHLFVVLFSLFLASIIGMTVGVIVWNKSVSRSLTIAAASASLTIPSLALLALITPIFGLGWVPTIVALVFYSLLPIVRNTVVGLREVSPAIMESAKGMGMSPLKIMLSIQLPISWPIILAGIRVAAQLTIGIAAIAAYVAGPGLGQFIFQGLSSLGSKNALNYALTGTLGVILLALVIDGAFVLIARITTARGLRV